MIDIQFSHHANNTVSDSHARDIPCELRALRILRALRAVRVQSTAPLSITYLFINVGEQLEILGTNPYLFHLLTSKILFLNQF